jgi:hypothetical protein
MAKKTTKRATPKPKKDAWFVQVRGSYLPASDMGWFTYIPFVAYLGFSWYVGINDTSSYSKAVLWIFPNWVAAAVLMTWIAKRHS